MSHSPSTCMIASFARWPVATVTPSHLWSFSFTHAQYRGSDLAPLSIMWSYECGYQACTEWSSYDSVLCSNWERQKPEISIPAGKPWTLKSTCSDVELEEFCSLDTPFQWVLQFSNLRACSLMVNFFLQWTNLSHSYHTCLQWAVRFSTLGMWHSLLWAIM